MIVLLSAISCTDSAFTPQSARLGSADSARLGIGQRSSHRATLAASDPGLVLVSADPGFFMGFAQPNPLTFTFSGPVRQVTIVGNGAISCSGDLGTLTGYDVDGNVIGSTSLQLISPIDCGPDDVTFGASATLITDKIMAKAILSPMSNLAFPVFNLTGHASQTYSLTLGRGPAPPATAKVDCGGSLTRVETVHCRVTVDPAQPWIITKRSSSGAGYSFSSSERIELASGEEHDWKGIAVISTDVTIAVSIIVNGTETAIDPATAHFEVNARTGREWTGFKLGPAPAPQFVTSTPLPTNPFTSPNSLASPKGALGMTDFLYSYPTAAVGSGPNTNLVYAKAPFSLKSVAIYVHGMLQAGSAFYNARPFSTNVISGVKPCLRSDIDKLRNGVIAHENKHYSEAKAFFDATDAQKAFEATRAPIDVANITEDSFKAASDAAVSASFGAALDQKSDKDVDNNNPISTPSCDPSKS